MKKDRRELLADVRAAMRTGSIESVHMALDRLRRMPEISGNHPLDAVVLEKTLLPVGEILSSPGIPLSALHDLTTDRLAALRAVAAAACALRYLHGEDSARQDLETLCDDRRPEVGRIVRAVLVKYSFAHSPRLLTLAQDWLLGGSTRRALALDSLSPLANLHTSLLFDMADACRQDIHPEVRRALAGLLNSLAYAGQAGQVLARFDRWMQETPPPEWVICRSLSASWAAVHFEHAQAILSTLEVRYGTTRQITNARRALARHAHSANEPYPPTPG